MASLKCVTPAPNEVACELAPQLRQENMKSAWSPWLGRKFGITCRLW